MLNSLIYDVCTSMTLVRKYKQKSEYVVRHGLKLVDFVTKPLSKPLSIYFVFLANEIFFLSVQLTKFMTLRYILLQTFEAEFVECSTNKIVANVMW